MEVEITGTPEPTVTWYKDDIPIKERPDEIRIKQLGNCYVLLIEKGDDLHRNLYDREYIEYRDLNLRMDVSIFVGLICSGLF